jgi:ribonuclease T2
MLWLLPIAAATGGCTNGDNSFDYFLFVTQWPGAYPALAKGAEPTYFTMHGLWPSRDGKADDANSYPCECTEEKFDPEKLQPIAADMAKYWPSDRPAGHPDNDAFWSHEWEKHGTCSGAPSQLAYFQTTLGFRAKLDPFGALQAAGIKAGTSASAEEFTQAFQKHSGAAPLLGCVGDNELSGVAFCLGKSLDHISVQECAEPVKHTGGSMESCSLSKPITLPAHGSPSPSPGPSPGPHPGPSPSPSGDSCVPDHRGPPCKADTDCHSFSDCIRCAHSGFCTSQPDQVVV